MDIVDRSTPIRRTRLFGHSGDISVPALLTIPEWTSDWPKGCFAPVAVYIPRATTMRARAMTQRHRIAAFVAVRPASIPPKVQVSADDVLGRSRPALLSRAPIAARYAKKRNVNSISPTNADLCPSWILHRQPGPRRDAGISQVPHRLVHPRAHDRPRRPGSHTSCGTRESARRAKSACAWSSGRTGWSPRSPCSKRAAPTCRSTRPIPRRGWTSCAPTAASRSCWHVLDLARGQGERGGLARRRDPWRQRRLPRPHPGSGDRSAPAQPSGAHVPLTQHADLAANTLSRASMTRPWASSPPRRAPSSRSSTSGRRAPEDQKGMSTPAWSASSTASGRS